MVSERLQRTAKRAYQARRAWLGVWTVRYPDSLRPRRFPHIVALRGMRVDELERAMETREQTVPEVGVVRAVRGVACGIDFSPTSDAVFRAAVELARAHSAWVALVHVVRHRREMAPARLRLEAWARERVPSGPVMTFVARGWPPRELAHLAGYLRADVIVIGGHPPSAALVPDDVQTALDQLAPCPILHVLPSDDPAAAARRAEALASLEHPCIMCGKPSLERVCASCRFRVVAELMQRKWIDERGEQSRGLHIEGIRPVMEPVRLP